MGLKDGKANTGAAKTEAYPRRTHTRKQVLAMRILRVSTTHILGSATHSSVRHLLAHSLAARACFLPSIGNRAPNGAIAYVALLKLRTRNCLTLIVESQQW